ncbi:hypothetical protein H8957_007540 [Semnopithecus entellus]
MSICTKLCPCHGVLGGCPCTGAWPVCAQAPRLWGPGSQRCERGKHSAGASEPSQPRFDAGRLTSSFLSSAQASCGPSSGCATSTAPSCPARPSVSSTTSSSSPWPARWPTRCWRGSSWRPSVSSTCPWAPSGPAPGLWSRKLWGQGQQARRTGLRVTVMPAHLENHRPR